MRRALTTLVAVLPVLWFSCNDQEAPANPNTVRLFEAIYEGDSSQVEQLLRSGTSPEARGLDTKMLGGAGIYPLHCAANFKRAGIARILLVHGAGPNVRTRTEEVALHYSARLGDLPTARVLQEGGADPNAADRTCKSVLQVARDGGNEELVAYLIRNGATKHAHFTAWQKYWHRCQN